MTETITESDVVSAEGAALTPREAELIAFIERAAVEHAMLAVAAQELVDADQALEHCVTVADIGAGNARKQAALATVRELLEHVGELPTDQLAQQASRPSLDAVPPSGVARSAGHSSIKDEECALHPDCEFGGCMLQNMRGGAVQNIRMLPEAFARLGGCGCVPRPGVCGGCAVTRAGGDLDRAHAMVQDARAAQADAEIDASEAAALERVRDRAALDNDSGRSALLGRQQSGLTASICQNAECARELPPKARLCFEAGSSRLFCNQVCLMQQQERERGRASRG